MPKIRVEWPTDKGGYKYVKTSLRGSFKGNPYFEADGPFDRTHVFVIKDDGDIIAKLKGDRRGAWVTVGQMRESFSGITYWIGPADELSIVEQRDRDYPMAQQWKQEHEALKAMGAEG